MKYEEIALEILKISIASKKEPTSIEASINLYHQILESLRNYKSETTLGKLKELIEEYDEEKIYSGFKMMNLIDKFRKTLN